MGVTKVGKEAILNRMGGDSAALSIEGFGWGSTWYASPFDSSDSALAGDLRHETLSNTSTSYGSTVVVFESFLADSNIGGASESVIREVGLFADSATPGTMFTRHQFADVTKDSSLSITCKYRLEFKRWSE